MRYDIKYKTHPIGARGVWKRGSLKELLLDIPYLFGFGPFPTRDEINALLATGKRDAGMSGGCDWDPFQISEAEYDELVLEFLTDPAPPHHVQVPDPPERRRGIGEGEAIPNDA